MGVRGLVKYLKSNSQQGVSDPFDHDVQIPLGSTICIDATGFSFFVVEQGFDSSFGVFGGFYMHYDQVCPYSSFTLLRLDVSSLLISTSSYSNATIV